MCYESVAALMEIVGYYLVKQIVIQRMLMPVRKPGEEKCIYISKSRPLLKVPLRSG